MRTAKVRITGQHLTRLPSLQCTYGNRLTQTRGVKYVAHLERKVQELECQARKPCESSRATDSDELPGANTEEGATGRCHWPSDEIWGRKDSQLQANGKTTMDAITSTPLQVLSDDRAVTPYRGKPSGIEILCHLLRFCNMRVGLADDSGVSIKKLISALDHSFPLHYISLDSMTNVFIPTLAKLRRWVDIAFYKAFTLWPFIDRELFDMNVTRLFEHNNFGDNEADRDYLGLIYAVLALGQRYDPALGEVNGGIEFANTKG